MNFELFKTIQKFGFGPVPGYSDKFCSWIHADDLADLLITVAQKGERLTTAHYGYKGEGIYFAASDEGRKWSEIIRIIGNSMGKDRVRTLYCGPIGLGIISTFYEIKKRWTGKLQPVDWEKVREAFHHWTCSPEKARTQLGFSTMPLEERMNQTTQWFIENGWLPPA